MARIQAENAERAAGRNRDHAKDPEQLRVSETDPEARRMKMPDGGFRPAFNVPFATTTAGGMIVGVAVTNASTDAKELPPMVDPLASRYGQRPREALVDGGFASLDPIDRVEGLGVAVLAPVKQAAAGRDPHAPRKGRLASGGGVTCTDDNLQESDYISSEEVEIGVCERSFAES